MPRHRLFTSLSFLSGRNTVLLLSTALTFAVQATEVYVSRDKDGSVYISDQPHQGAETHKVKPLSTIPGLPTAARPAPSDTQSTEAKHAGYQQLAITSPVDHTTFPSASGGNVQLSYQLTPPLQAGDTLTLLDNQQPKAALSGSNNQGIALSNLDRGSHVLQLQVRDKQGKVIKQSSPITVYIQRHSILNRRPASDRNSANTAR